MPIVEDLARRHGVSVAAVQVLQDALSRGGGRQAQFSHPDLGGMGQWSSGGMTQVGDMFNTSLKAKVNALCQDLADDLARNGADDAASQPGQAERTIVKVAGGKRAGDWWPDGLGRPSATGSQNSMRYACFPETRRVAIEQAGAVTVYDSGDHRISGVSQAQSGTQDLSFSSQHGTIRASDLTVVP